MNAATDYEITIPDPDSNTNAKDYKIKCIVNDGYDNYEFVFSVTALFNEPPDLSGSIATYEIEYFNTATSYNMPIGTHCVDEEGDALYEYIYYSGTSIETAGDFNSLFTYDKANGRLTIDDGIRTYSGTKNFTYQMLYTCTDEYNPRHTVDTAFRIVVKNSNQSPTSSKSQPLIEMFYQSSTYEFTIDTSAFYDVEGIQTYAAVGTLNDDKIMDNTYEVTATVTGTRVRLSNFYPHTNAQVQGGVIVEGYIKAMDVNAQAAYSRFVLLKIRKSHLLI